MGPVLTIAKRDIIAFFASPKGAALFWFFLLMIGLFFHSFISTYVELESQAPMMGGQAPTLEQLLRALVYNSHFILVLLIPGFTMAAFAEEKKMQSFRLLQTAPISPVQIVFGKFLASAGLIGLILLASSVYPGYLAAFGNPDIGIMLTSYLGLFLLMCSQVAFGLWVSSMTTNQFLAFVFTLFGLLLLMILNWIAPNISGGGTLEVVTKYLASTEHLDVFLKGMISIKSVTYFLCFIAMFLFFTTVVLDSQRWR